MGPNSEESSIERLKRNLYSRNEALVPKEKRTPVPPHELEVKSDWGDNPSFNLNTEDMVKKNNSFFNKFLMYSVGFFILSLAVALFIFYGGLNMISSNNLDINIIAPSTVSSGEELSAGLSVVNGNRTDLEEVALFIDYPDGAAATGEENKILTHDKINLGTIPKGKSADYTINAVLFGEKDAVKTFILKLEYKVKGSNAIFSKEKTFDVSIGSSPLIMDIDYPKEVNSGQIITINVSLTSNSTAPIQNTLVKVEYPYGFTYKDSNINPYRDNSIWNLGDLKGGDKKVLTIRGVLVGQNLEDRSFRISAGSQSSDNLKDFETPLATGIFTMGIRKSFYNLTVTADNDIAYTAGQYIPVTIKWQNTLPDKILNNKIEVAISGNAFDRNKVTSSGGGFYQSINNMIVWDKNGTNSLLSILPGDSNQVSFTLSSIADLTSGRLIKNPHIDLHVVMSGDRSGTDATTIFSEEDVTIKIASNLGIKAKTLRDVGPFTNTGPIPPRADNESTYTVTWTLLNSTNDVKNTIVSATLPAGIVWKGETSPINEKIDYNSDNRTITWNVGGVSAGVGYSFAPREVSFKVGLAPSINQIGSVPSLTSNISATAMDTYTEKSISSSAQAVTTRYSDPSFVPGKEIVTK
ncbi:MAG: hypothetical protein AB201_02775 [Parcubacteria bacterium C7867-006]|nr:MAG: hypothetical protein AB201_02775 [Parcubacteria bacterium C7867-006]